MLKPVLILDAFGVLYQPADDVAEYLVPFVLQRGGSTDEEYIKAEYQKSSLGQMTSAQFWQRIGLQPDVEDDYLALIPLSVGVHPFMEAFDRRLTPSGAFPMTFLNGPGSSAFGTRSAGTLTSS